MIRITGEKWAAGAFRIKRADEKLSQYAFENDCRRPLLSQGYDNLRAGSKPDCCCALTCVHTHQLVPAHGRE